MKMNTLIGMRRDFIASHLRSQIYTLQTVLKDIESDYDFNEEGATEDLKKVENMLRQIRKVTCEY
jgi:hypothetical protein